MLDIVYVGDRPVAAHFGLRSDTVLAGWFPAYDTDFARYPALRHDRCGLRSRDPQHRHGPRQQGVQGQAQERRTGSGRGPAGPPNGGSRNALADPDPRQRHPEHRAPPSPTPAPG
ncbi:GNAT family N-acetyltransferase [Nonomuraea sp. K274]|uniref:GNAT family N-acetyltransferase n=1 Tax=Nonomuraea cypriaca TaxID=1187855 RepID=A0A931AA81_9ACTN|nr:GNAT family N-acetyltransferase [Nonomuraea cypriaca]